MILGGRGGQMNLFFRILIFSNISTDLNLLLELRMRSDDGARAGGG